MRARAKNLDTAYSFLGLLKRPNKIQEKIEHNPFEEVNLFLRCLGWKRVNFSWQSPRNSLNCKANDDKFNFDNTDKLTNPNDNYSAGLLVLR